MSVYLYDEALVKNLRKITGDNRIYITHPDNMFDTIARSEKDEIQMPIISLFRTGWSISDNLASFPKKFEGVLTKHNDEEDTYHRLQSMAIDINYQLDVWTDSRLENDTIMREIIFYYSTHPRISLKIPYDSDIRTAFNIFLDNDIEDNSDIIDHKNRGEYYRQTLSIYTDEARLWKTSSRGPTTVDVDVEILEDNEYRR